MRTLDRAYRYDENDDLLYELRLAEQRAAEIAKQRADFNATNN